MTFPCFTFWFASQAGVSWGGRVKRGYEGSALKKSDILAASKFVIAKLSLELITNNRHEQTTSLSEHFSELNYSLTKLDIFITHTEWTFKSLCLYFQPDVSCAFNSYVLVQNSFSLPKTVFRRYFSISNILFGNQSRKLIKWNLSNLLTHFGFEIRP